MGGNFYYILASKGTRATHCQKKYFVDYITFVINDMAMGNGMACHGTQLITGREQTYFVVDIKSIDA